MDPNDVVARIVVHHKARLDVGREQVPPYPLRAACQKVATVLLQKRLLIAACAQLGDTDWEAFLDGQMHVNPMRAPIVRP